MHGLAHFPTKLNIVRSGAVHLGLSDHSLIFAVRKHVHAFSPRKKVLRYAQNFKMSMPPIFFMIFHKFHGKMRHCMTIKPHAIECGGHISHRDWIVKHR